MVKMYNRESKRVAIGGIVTLLSTLSLYMSSILPTNRLFFFALSTFFLASIVIEINTKFAILVYISSALLSFIMIPNKTIVLPYIIFFGYYAIIKSIIERINMLLIEILIKLFLFNLSIYIEYTIFSKVLLGDIIFKLPAWILFILIQLAFIIYDYSFSICIYFYRTKIRTRIKKQI